MAQRKTRTDAEKDRAKDLRLQRKYGITLARRNEIAVEQNQRCKMCGGALDAFGPPNVDHFHFRITCVRHLNTISTLYDGWCAVGYDEQDRAICIRHAKTKVAATKAVRDVMLPWSVRGLLCSKCNRGAGMTERFFDAARHPDNLLMIIAYYKLRLGKSLTSL